MNELMPAGIVCGLFGAFAFAFIWAMIAADIGARKGLEGWGGIAGFFLGPLGILVIWAARGDRKECPTCFELVQARARVCPHCLAPQPAEAPAPPAAPPEPPENSDPSPVPIEPAPPRPIAAPDPFYGKCRRCQRSADLVQVFGPKGGILLCPQCAVWFRQNENTP